MWRTLLLGRKRIGIGITEHCRDLWKVEIITAGAVWVGMEFLYIVGTAESDFRENKHRSRVGNGYFSDVYHTGF
jgi:hypothetical protein